MASEADTATGVVVAVAKDGEHRFSKVPAAAITIISGLGVEGDGHKGVTIQHRSRVAADSTQPNLRQVHLLHTELFEELGKRGFTVSRGDMGENIATRGIDLLGLPRGCRLRVGPQVVLEVTGLRNPCAQIERFRSGLLAAVLDRGPNGEVVRKAGIMAVVLEGGVVQPGDVITMDLPSLPHLPLESV